MSMRLILVGACVALVCVTGCGDDASNATDAGPGTDSGTASDLGAGTDSGPRVDAGRDAGGGGTDLCAGEQGTNLSSGAGCNGGLLGSDRAANSFGGTCTGGSESNPAGTCTDSGAICDGSGGGGTGICLIPCASASTYTSTSDCPTGSRCFTFSAAALCYPDCESGTDCATNNCDVDGSCAAPEEVPVDGGVETDAGGGTDAGGATDAGAADAGAADAGIAAVEEVSCEGVTPAEVVAASAGAGFAASPVFVGAGNIVQFNNSDSFAHTVTSRTSSEGAPVSSGLFNASLPGSGSVCLRFNANGSYPYYCTIHTSMLGVVEVGSF
jgi:plastocyanin